MWRFPPRSAALHIMSEERLDYEKARQENLKRNAEVLASLGLGEVKAPKKEKKNARKRETVTAVRRSSRKKQKVELFSLDETLVKDQPSR